MKSEFSKCNTGVSMLLFLTCIALTFLHSSVGFGNEISTIDSVDSVYSMPREGTTQRILIDSPHNVVSLYEQDGQCIWTVSLPMRETNATGGASHVRGCRIMGGKVFLTLAKHDCVSIDLETGTCQFLGAD